MTFADRQALAMKSDDHNPEDLLKWIREAREAFARDPGGPSVDEGYQVIEGWIDAYFERVKSVRPSLPKLGDITNTIYKSIIGACEELERRGKERGFFSNGHHFAQRLVILIEQELLREKLFVKDGSETPPEIVESVR
jgi:hypothetical protein